MIRAVEGPIATVRGARPEDVGYTGAAAAALREVWIDLRTSMRGVLETTTLADLVERSREAQTRSRAGQTRSRVGRT